MDGGAFLLKALDRWPKEHGFIIRMRSDDQGCATFHFAFIGTEATLDSVQVYNDLGSTNAMLQVSRFRK
jgi:hypothetical protein